jgi:imidazole glycerol phosphate synthase subunit HisF
MLKMELVEKIDTLALIDKDGFVLMQEKFHDLEESGTQVVLLQEVEDDEIALLACASEWGMMRIAQSMVMKVAEQTGIPFPFLVSQLMGPILGKGSENDEE